MEVLFDMMTKFRILAEKTATDLNFIKQARCLRKLQRWVDTFEGSVSLDTMPPLECWEDLSEEQKRIIISANKWYNQTTNDKTWDGDTTSDIVAVELEKLGYPVDFTDEDTEAYVPELKEGLGSLARNALLGATVALGGMQGANAKTDHELLHNNHEIIAKYEHGGKGYNAIVKDNYGGYSYGKYQISTERRNNLPSTFDFFLKYLKNTAPGIYTNLQKAGGQPAAFKGTKQFKEKWLQLAKRKDFRDVYDNFILNTQVVPTYDRLDRAGNAVLDKITTWGSHNNAIQAAIKSAIVQHGPNGAYNLIKKVANANPKNEAEFLAKLYNQRIAKYPKYKSRYTSEYADLKALLAKTNTNIDMAYGKRPGESGQQLDALIKKLAS